MKLTMMHGTTQWMGLALAAALAQAAEPALTVGSAAPKLQTGRWVQGEPVKEFERGKAYLVEFWATWCGPCRVSIPHLNELHHQFKDQGLVVIGQDCWERDESLVEPFIKKMGDQMTYRVALDDKQGNPNGRMAESWMAAVGRNGIPSAFLVDPQGRLAWIGHPMQLKPALIEAVLAGKFDVDQAAADYVKQQQNEGKLRTLWQELSRAMQDENWAVAKAKLSEAEALMTAEQREGLGVMRFNLLVGQQDYAAAFQLAEQLSDAQPRNAMLQNQLAWQIATDPKLKQRDLKLVEKIARRANEAAQGKDPAILDTLARVLFMRDQHAAAIELQERAVRLASGPMKEELAKTLASYRKGEVPAAE